MIYLKMNTHDFENDVRVMTLAFYPGMKIVTDASMIEQCDMAIEVSVGSSYIEFSVKKKDYHGEIHFDFNTDDRKLIRNRLKRELYNVFSNDTGKKLPWGTLTGIRPTKIPYGLIEQGYDESYIVNNLKNEYLMSDRKINLAIQVAHNEHRILDDIDCKKGYSLYVGIPFCPTTCLYCSFTSYPLGMWKERVDDYLDALEKELIFLGKYLKNKKADSVYIGGGTPTTLLPYQSDRLISCIEDNFNLDNIKEFTVEAGRPDSIDSSKLDVLRKHNIDRISINPQTMNERTLSLIGRRHTTQDVIKAFWLARDKGFENINMDLIMGLPDENIDDVRHTLEEVGKLSPDSLTVHSLAIKRAARLNIFKEKYANYSITNTDEIMNMTYDFAAASGMEPYYLYRQKNMAGSFENVGYSKPDKMGIYNMLIMEERQSIYAAGANAQSKIVYNDPPKVDRIENVKDVGDYIDRIDEMIERKRRYFYAGI